MPQTDFLNKNLYRRYPLQDLPGRLTGNVELPLSTFVDIGFVIGPSVSFAPETQVVRLHSITRDGSSGPIYFDFRPDPSTGTRWVFTRELDAAPFTVEFTDAVPVSSPPPFGLESSASSLLHVPPSAGEAYLVTGRLDNLISLLPAGATLLPTSGDFIVEPATVQVLHSYVQDIKVANDLRPELQCQEWPDVATAAELRAVTDHDQDEPAKMAGNLYLYDELATEADDGVNYIKPDNVTGAGRWILNPDNVTLLQAIYGGPYFSVVEGYNCQIEFSDSDNSVTVSAVAGFGEGGLCEEAPGYTTLIGCRCMDGISSINGIGPVSGNINILGRMGIAVTAVPAENKLELALSASKSNVCDIPDAPFDFCFSEIPLDTEE